LGHSGIFLFRTIFCPSTPFKTCGLVVEQLYVVGVLSLLIVILAALFIGMVIALQGNHTLEQFGATQQLGQLVALSVVRELGPVVTGLLFAGRAGTALTAEIGLMRATEQISSMEMMAVDPMRYVVFPRFVAGVVSMPILAAIFSAMAIVGAYWVGVDWLGLDAGSFWSNMQSGVNFRLDVVNGLIKSLVFGFVATWVALYQGFYAEPTSAGIGKATTRTVVMSSLMILALDFVLTAMMLGDW
jgi:phospholipid/cholesterol/gamma-HCH transport system permease protein